MLRQVIVGPAIPSLRFLPVPHDSLGHVAGDAAKLQPGWAEEAGGEVQCRARAAVQVVRDQVPGVRRNHKEPVGEDSI